MNKDKYFKKEIEMIKNERYKKSCVKLINMLPDYFFSVPASSTGKYHPSFSLGDKGLLRHSKAAVKIAYEMFMDESITGCYNNDQKDLMLISLMVHDGLKSGLEKQEYTKFEHPILMANYIKENQSILDFNEEEIKYLTECISSHMGPWNTNNYSNYILPKPVKSHQRFVHMCDFLASRKFLDIKFDDDNNIIN